MIKAGWPERANRRTTCRGLVARTTSQFTDEERLNNGQAGAQTTHSIHLVALIPKLERNGAGEDSGSRSLNVYNVYREVPKKEYREET